MALRWLRQVALAIAICCLTSMQGVAQDNVRVQSPVLIIDSTRLYVDSAFGRRVAAEVETANATLISENEDLERELEAEEKILTEQRADLTPQDFKTRADAFDEKVQRIRRAQESKAREIASRQDKARTEFLEASLPVLETMMNQAGAAVLLERRTVFISLNAIDITQAAIERINAQIGDGSSQGSE